MRFFLAITFLVSYFISEAQVKAYPVVDSFVRSLRLNVSTKEDLHVLINKIKEKFSSEEDRVRAAYYWVTENIAYDVEGYYTGKGIIFTALDAIKYKKAVCAGYADLLNYFFAEMGLQHKRVTGASRTSHTFTVHPDSLGSDHAWNAVQIDGEWKLMDATWGSGYLGRREFLKERKDEYFLMDPSIFIFTHLPDYTNWQLLKDTVVTQETFCKWPLIGNDFYEASITAIAPFEQKITGREGDEIHFRFTSSKKISRVVLMAENGMEFESWQVSPKNGIYKVSYRLKYAGLIKAYLGFEYRSQDKNERSWSAPFALGYLLNITMPAETLPSH